MFTLNAQSVASQILESIFSFNATTPGMVLSSIQLNSPLASGDGVVTGVLNTCAGNYSGLLSCSSVEQTAIAFRTADDSMLVDFSRFAASSFFDIFVDLTIDGGLTGTASLPSAVVGVAVPEPSAALLGLSGTLLIAAFRARKFS